MNMVVRDSGRSRRPSTQSILKNGFESEKDGKGYSLGLIQKVEYQTSIHFFFSSN